MGIVKTNAIPLGVDAEEGSIFPTCRMGSTTDYGTSGVGLRIAQGDDS